MPQVRLDLFGKGRIMEITRQNVDWNRLGLLLAEYLIENGVAELDPGEVAGVDDLYNWQYTLGDVTLEGTTGSPRGPSGRTEPNQFFSLGFCDIQTGKVIAGFESSEMWDGAMVDGEYTYVVDGDEGDLLILLRKYLP